VHSRTIDGACILYLASIDADIQFNFTEEELRRSNASRKTAW